MRIILSSKNHTMRGPGVGPFDLRERLVKQMDAKLLTSEFTILQIDRPKVLLVSTYLLIYWGANGICICI